MIFHSPLAIRYSPLIAGRCGRPCAGPGRRVQTIDRLPRLSISRRIVNLPPEVWPDFRRLRGIETALAAGHLPPPLDAVAENRAAPRAVPARLPEAHPRTDRTGITGGMAGSESTTRYPFPEAGRHK